ncbi:MAG: pantothenate synthetase [marine bacterium B5-7]|nr:MAG: pantothenate synthetase [marine bacterium B5-7]
MKFFNIPEQAASWCESERDRARTIGLVPTMGALHEGHLSLVEQALAENDLCVVSIFVNPLQFNEASDYEAYPRDIDTDLNLLKQYGCSMTFTGSLSDFFDGAKNPGDIPLLDPGPFAQGLESEHRPGHFAGVRTIVARLFQTVRPDRAYFGEKDYQQTLIITDLAGQLGYPEVVVCPTLREHDGLAMSSRNRRLKPAERAEAAGIYRALCAARTAWLSGQRHPAILSARMHEVLKTTSLEVEYAEVRDPNNWNAVNGEAMTGTARALIAVRCGEVRLIDNLELA